MSKYDEFAEFVRNKIRSGEWPPGHKLPSQAQWASGEAGHQILYGSMRGGYIVLRAEGWIVGLQGEGVYVSRRPPIEPKPEPPTEQPATKLATGVVGAEAIKKAAARKQQVGTKKRT